MSFSSICFPCLGPNIEYWAKIMARQFLTYLKSTNANGAQAFWRRKKAFGCGVFWLVVPKRGQEKKETFLFFFVMVHSWRPFHLSPQMYPKTADFRSRSALKHWSLLGTRNFFLIFVFSYTVWACVSPSVCVCCYKHSALTQRTSGDYFSLVYNNLLHWFGSSLCGYTFFWTLKHNCPSAVLWSLSERLVRFRRLISDVFTGR